MKFESINPFNNELIKTFDQISNEMMFSLIDDMHYHYNDWKILSLDERIQLIKLFIHELENEKEFLASLITLETAKPISQSRAEIEKCIYTCKFYIEEVKSYLAPIRINKSAQLQFESLGIIVGIMPWNFPIWQVIRFAIPTLLAGNVVLIKHAPSTPQCSLFLEHLFLKAIKNTSVYKQLFIDIDQIEILISNDKIKGVSLTGSTEAGRSVAQICAKYLKKYVLELGGSDPFIVCDDANLESCIDAAIESRCRNNGQSCIAAKRFIIQDTIYDEFVSKLKIKLAQLQYLLPSDENSYITSLARKDLKLKCDNQIKNLPHLGFTCIYTYESVSKSNNTIFPMIFECNEKSKFIEYQDELFAPIYLMFKFKNVEEAIAIANNTHYGLASAVWTSNPTTADFFETKMEAGMVYVNEMAMSDAALPFGGIKNSGIGKELGALGIKEFVNSKLVYKK